MKLPHQLCTAFRVRSFIKTTVSFCVTLCEELGPHILCAKRKFRIFVVSGAGQVSNMEKPIKFKKAVKDFCVKVSNSKYYERITRGWLLLIKTASEAFFTLLGEFILNWFQDLS